MWHRFNDICQGDKFELDTIVFKSIVCKIETYDKMEKHTYNANKSYLFGTIQINHLF